MKRGLITLVAVALGVLLLQGSGYATTLSYNNFSSLSGLQLNGTAKGVDNVLRLTDALWQSGSAFSTSTVTLSSEVSFSTYFQFQITHPMGISDSDGQGADGIVFVVQTVANNVGGSGGGIGYQYIPKSVGIEFDTWNNGGWDDNNGNHLGIDLNGEINSVLQTNVGTRMNDGAIWSAWVDYNGATDLLEVRLARESNIRPATASLQYTADLASVLGTPNAYVGFTSGTGAAGGYHDILMWQFNDSYKPIDPVATPEPSLVLLLLSGLVGIGAIARKAKK